MRATQTKKVFIYLLFWNEEAGTGAPEGRIIDLQILKRYFRVIFDFLKLIYFRAASLHLESSTSTKANTWESLAEFDKDQASADEMYCNKLYAEIAANKKNDLYAPIPLIVGNGKVEDPLVLNDYQKNLVVDLTEDFERLEMSHRQNWWKDVLL